MDIREHLIQAACYMGEMRMVYDTLENLKWYIPKKKRKVIEDFVSSINEQMQEGYYEIDGDEIFARVMVYDGKMREDCAIEAHNQYVDIQFTLIGIEGIDIFRRKELRERIEYNFQEDIVFFEGSQETCVQISNRPGYFSMIFPEEAHRPQIAADKKSVFIKKGVIKIKEKYYG